MIDMYKTDLYFECHITVDPIAYNKLEEIQDALDKFSFRPSKLILRTAKASYSGEEWRDDMFITTRGTDYTEVRTRMFIMIGILLGHGIPIRRYKIENTLLDIKV